MSLKVKLREAYSPVGFLKYLDPIEVPANSTTPVFEARIPEYENKFSYSGNILNYQLILNNSKIISNLDIDLNKLKQNKDFADQTLWAIDNTAIQNNISRIDEAESYTVKTEEFVALYTLTYPSKTGVFEDPNIQYGNETPLFIFVPSKNSTTEEVVFIVYTKDLGSPQVIFTSTGDIETSIGNFSNIVSPITISASKSSLNPDDSVVLTVTTGDPTITELYVEPVFGSTNKTRVRLINGVGTVTVYSTDLFVGEEVRIKFGYKWYSGVAEYTNIIT